MQERTLLHASRSARNNAAYSPYFTICSRTCQSFRSHAYRLYIVFVSNIKTYVVHDSHAYGNYINRTFEHSDHFLLQVDRVEHVLKVLRNILVIFAYTNLPFVQSVPFLSVMPVVSYIC